MTGQAIQNVKVRTRAEPKAATGGRVLHVYPLTWPATVRRNSRTFTGLMAAYNGYVGTGDWNVVALHKAEPGDTIPRARRSVQGRPAQLRRSVRPDVRRHVSADGERHRRQADRDQVRGRRRGDLRRRRRVPPVRRDGLRVPHLRGDHVPQHRGRVLGRRQRCGGRDGADGQELPVRERRRSASKRSSPDRPDFYIADNVFLGRDDHYRTLGWANPGLYGAHPINSYYAIKIYGSGHIDRAQRGRVLSRRHLRFRPTACRIPSARTGPWRSTSTTTTST